MAASPCSAPCRSRRPLQRPAIACAWRSSATSCARMPMASWPSSPPMPSRSPTAASAWSLTRLRRGSTTSRCSNPERLSTLKEIIMIRVVSVLVALLLSATALSRPVILQSMETIPSPDPSYTYFGYDLAIDGDWAIISGEKWQDLNDEYSPITYTAFLFRRVNASWVFQRKLVERQGSADYILPSGVAMREGIAVVRLLGLYIFELSGNDYVARNVSGVSSGLGSDIDISNRRILFGAGDCAWNGAIMEISTANNRSEGTTTLPGESKDGCNDDFYGGPVEITGDLACVAGGGVFHRSG